jgi:hypothetical protein
VAETDSDTKMQIRIYVTINSSRDKSPLLLIYLSSVKDLINTPSAWREDWPKIEDQLHQLARQHRPQIHRKHHFSPTTSLIALALQGDFDYGPTESSPSTVARKKSLAQLQARQGSFPTTSEYLSHTLLPFETCTSALNSVQCNWICSHR